MASRFTDKRLAVDLSQVVSRYIGETEKNLDRLFAEAERSGTVLFFDEADELFSSDSENAKRVRRWMERHKVIVGKKP